MAQAGCPRLICSQIIMVQVIEDLLNTKTNFGAKDLINIYRFIEKHQSNLSNPPAETTYEERINPDGSITKITATHSVETHQGSLPFFQPPVTVTAPCYQNTVYVPQPPVVYVQQPVIATSAPVVYTTYTTAPVPVVSVPTIITTTTSGVLPPGI
jgi:hypothetical protein